MAINARTATAADFDNITQRQMLSGVGLLLQ